MARCSVCGRKMPVLTFGKKVCVWCRQHEAQQRGELPENAPQTVMAAPWQQGLLGDHMMATKVLIAINVLMFVVELCMGASPISPDTQVMSQLGANFGPLTLSGQWWRLFTYAFLHYGVIHVAMNMWCLWNLGGLAESLFGRWTFVSLYLLTAMSGGMLSLKAHAAAVSAGASASVFGIAGALIAALYLGEFALPREIIWQVLRNVGYFVLLNLVLGSVIGFVDNAGHIGGLLGGALAGALIAKLAAGRDAIAGRVVIFAVLIGLMSVGCWSLQHTYAEQARYETYSTSDSDDSAELDRALAQLKQVVADHPQDASAHSTLANVYYRKRDYANAAVELRHAIEISPKNHENYYALGLVYMEQKDYKSALAPLKKAAELDDDKEIEEALAEAYRGVGDEASAKEAERRASRI